VNACSYILKSQIRIINPDIILTLGKPAANRLLGNNSAISRLRGNVCDFHGIKLLPTYHPAFLLRRQPDPKKKIAVTPAGKQAWSDLKLLKKLYDK
jgi:DNA polymerase